jgi:methionine biosynthesis protein MetW
MFSRLTDTYRTLFSYPVQTLSSTPPDYDEYWRDKRGKGLGMLSSWQKQRADLARSFIDSKTPSTLLDVGCGDGSVLRYFKEKGNVKSAIGVDVSELALRKAQESGIETHQLDISDQSTWEKIPHADYVFLFEVLEHIPDPERFLKLMREKASQGVFFSFPNTGYVMHRLRLLFGRFPLQWRIHPGEHLRFWTHRDLIWWLEATGIERYELKTYEGVPLLKFIWPSLFSAALFVYVPKR